MEMPLRPSEASSLAAARVEGVEDARNAAASLGNVPQIEFEDAEVARKVVGFGLTRLPRENGDGPVHCDLMRYEYTNTVGGKELRYKEKKGISPTNPPHTTQFIFSAFKNMCVEI